MKKLLALIILVLVMPVLCYGLGVAPEKAKRAAYPYLIDNFEDGNFNKDPEWFTFDKVIPTVAKNSSLKSGDPAVASNVGEYSLNLKGAASNWYVGGIGTVLGIAAAGYDSFEIDIYGNGENSGLLKIELYDDDNGNSDIEVDKSWKPLYDDLWSYEQKIDWVGWKHVSIPVSQFTNAGRGNGVFDPGLKNNSGGLVKIQLICVANAETGSIDFNIDNLELGVKK